MLCRVGWTLFLYYLGSLGYYIYVRVGGMNLGLYNIYRWAAQPMHLCCTLPMRVQTAVSDLGRLL